MNKKKLFIPTLTLITILFILAFIAVLYIMYTLLTGYISSVIAVLIVLVLGYYIFLPMFITGYVIVASMVDAIFE